MRALVLLPILRCLGQNEQHDGFGAENPAAVQLSAVPLEVVTPLQPGDCVLAEKTIEYEDLNGGTRTVNRNDKGVLVSVAADHVVVKWNSKETLARAAAFHYQVKRPTWPKGPIFWEGQTELTCPEAAQGKECKCPTQQDIASKSCLTVVEYHGFPPMVTTMACKENWWNQQFTTPLSCRPGSIYWRKDTSLCLDAVHPDLIQLRECDGRPTQMFALQAEQSGCTGGLVGTGVNQDMCIRAENELEKNESATPKLFGDLTFEDCRLFDKLRKLPIPRWIFPEFNMDN